MTAAAALTFDFDSEEFRGTSPRQFVAYIGRRFQRAHFAVTRGALEAMSPEARVADDEQLFAAAAGQVVQAVYRLHNQGLVTPEASILIDEDNWRDRGKERPTGSDGDDVMPATVKTPAGGTSTATTSK